MFDEKLISAVEELNENKVIQIVKKYLQAGESLDYLIEQIQIGMVKVGIKYEKGEYFIADLIMAGQIFEEVIKLAFLNLQSQPSPIGKIVIGTVQGDLHDIAKNLFINMAQVAGFETYDLGTDVAPTAFVEEVRKVRADILAMSGVMTFTIESMKKTILLLEEKGLRQEVKVLAGGSHLNTYIAKYLKVDAFATTIEEGLKICKSWALADKNL